MSIQCRQGAGPRGNAAAQRRKQQEGAVESGPQAATEEVKEVNDVGEARAVARVAEVKGTAGRPEPESRKSGLLRSSDLLIG